MIASGTELLFVAAALAGALAVALLAAAWIRSRRRNRHAPDTSMTRRQAARAGMTPDPMLSALGLDADEVPEEPPA